MKEMTAMETARINEVLALQITIVREFAGNLEPKDLKLLRTNLGELEIAVKALKELVEALPG